MNKHAAGDRVFADVDGALADRIISRSMENSRETEPVTDGNPLSPEIESAGRKNGIDDFPLLPEGSVPVVKIVALLLVLIVLTLLFFRRRDG